jgi:hypothetical protein
MSGVVALHLGTGPIRRFDEDDLRRNDALGRAPEAEPAPYELAPPDPAAAPPTLMSAANTLSDLPRPITTVPGLPPPPIPVPPGLGPPSIPPPPGQPTTNTLVGMGRSTPPAIPTVKRAPSVSGIPPMPPPAVRKLPTRPELDLAIPIDAARPATLTDASTESAVHPLDPDDLESVDPASLEGDTVLGIGAAGAAALDAPMSPVGESAARSARMITPLTGPPGPPDDLDGPTHAMLGDQLLDEAPTVPPAEPPSTTYRLDPSSIDTKPIPPVTLEPLLFDPIEPPPRAGDLSSAGPERGPVGAPARSTEPPPERPVLDEARWFDEASVRSPAPVREPGSNRIAMPLAADPVPTEVKSEPRSEKIGHTILGVAAPSLPPRAPTPLPFPPSPPPERRPPADPLSAMVLEGFHTAPAPVSEVQDWRDVGVIPPAEVSQITRSPRNTPGEAAPVVPPNWVPTPSPPSPIQVSTPSRGRRRAMWLAVGLAGAAIVGVGAWQVYVQIVVPPSSLSPVVVNAPADARQAAPPDAAQIATAPPDAAEVAAAPADAARVAIATPAPVDAAKVVAAPADAAKVTAVPADAAQVAAAPRDAAGPADAAKVAAVPPGPPTGPGDHLSITSTPPGARVFLDGSDVGATPLTLNGSPDRHALVVLLAGHELYQKQVDGHGAFQIQLKEITPSNGPAGIKVLRCKDKDRYYVFVDGKPTGQACPTERIGCEVGPHTVEVYDIATDTRRKWDIVVKDTRLSFRVRVDP